MSERESPLETIGSVRKLKTRASHIVTSERLHGGTTIVRSRSRCDGIAEIAKKTAGIVELAILGEDPRRAKKAVAMAFREIAQKKGPPTLDSLVMDVFDVRLANLLIGAGCTDLRSVAMMRPADLLAIDNFGDKCLATVQQVVRDAIPAAAPPKPRVDLS